MILFTLLIALILVVVVFNEKKKKERAADTQRQELVEAGSDQNLQKFNLTGFDEKGKQFWNLEGDMAKIPTGETVYLDKNVTLRLKNDTIVRTDHMQWNQSTGLLNTKAPVFVDHQNTRVKGIGAYGLLNEGFIQLNREIQMVINETTLLTCDGPMKVYYKDNKMTYYRNVKVVDAKGTLWAKRMDVFFDPEQKRIDKIIAVGDVVMQRGSDKTRSQRAIYTVATGSVRLEGSPEVTIHKDGAALLNKGVQF